MLFIFLLAMGTYIVLGFSNSRGSRTLKTSVHFCDRGMEGHNDRVAEFYGFDSHKDMLKAEGIDIDEIERKIESGQYKVVKLNFQDWLNREKEE